MIRLTSYQMGLSNDESINLTEVVMQKMSLKQFILLRLHLDIVC